MSALPLTCLGAPVRARGDDAGAGRGEQTRGRLVRGAAALRNLAAAVLGVALRSAATAGLVLLAVLWAEGAHDLALVTRERRTTTGRRHVPSASPEWAASR